MKNFKIGVKIFVGFTCVFGFLLSITVTSVITSVSTGNNISDIEIYSGLQSNANDLMHILNESRITAGTLYSSRTKQSYDDLTKQLMYCDVRLKKLYDYIDNYERLTYFRKSIEEFDVLYTNWRTQIVSLNNIYNFDEELSLSEIEAFITEVDFLRKENLIAHELLSNTISSMNEFQDNKVLETKTSNVIAIWTVILISVISGVAAIILAKTIMTSITKPITSMQDILRQFGQTGDLRLSSEAQKSLFAIKDGKDETAECIAALLTLIERLNGVDKTLSFVAEGDLTINVSLQSQKDTMGLAVKKMVNNLNQKFSTISSSTGCVFQKTGELADGSALLAKGSKDQSESVGHLLKAVNEVSQKTEKNMELAKHAAGLSNNIQKNANSGTENMMRMIQAVDEINEASQSIERVIKVIDDIAFQTNILALNAAVEAARAGHHGKGFAVVAGEVRNLAAKSAEAAKNTGSLIENTIEKAHLGASIAEITSKSFQEIVTGVAESSEIVNNMANYFNEQVSDIRQILSDVEQVQVIVEQNNMIATQSADATAEISEHSNVLNEMISQFKLLKE